jgi:hypothetical protein
MAFRETALEDRSQEREELLQRNISDLGLAIEGTRLEPLITRLYQDLERAGIDFKPPVYLADEWGCPDRVPTIGIPFYLADEDLCRLEDELMEGIEAESDDEILRYLRHEAGHAINYAYKLYDSEEWRELFGPYSRPYREDYEPNPFSRQFVRHIPGWYAQKHPDEDFAESFAVWLDPDSNWRETYAGWGCLPKLAYVDRTMRQVGRRPPLVTGQGREVSGELSLSLAEHYAAFRQPPKEIPAYFDGDLKQIFGETAPARLQGIPAAEFLERNRRSLVRNIAYWTGLNDLHIRSLIHHFIQRSSELGLRVDPARSTAVLTELTAYATTLCMNKLYKGDFIIR